MIFFHDEKRLMLKAVLCRLGKGTKALHGHVCRVTSCLGRELTQWSVSTVGWSLSPQNPKLEKVILNHDKGSNRDLSQMWKKIMQRNSVLKETMKSLLLGNL